MKPSLFLIILDQVTKGLFLSLLHRSIRINDFVSLEITRNTGLSLGILKGSFIERYVTRLRFIAICLLIIFFKIKNNKKFLIPSILIVSGAICNFLDGVLYGCVIDLFSLSFMKRFSIGFNFADMYATLGLAWFLACL